MLPEAIRMIALPSMSSLVWRRDRALAKSCRIVLLQVFSLVVCGFSLLVVGQDSKGVTESPLSASFRRWKILIEGDAEFWRGIEQSEHHLKIADDHFQTLAKYLDPALQSIQHVKSNTLVWEMLRLGSVRTTELVTEFERVASSIHGKGKQINQIRAIVAELRNKTIDFREKSTEKEFKTLSLKAAEHAVSLQNYYADIIDFRSRFAENIDKAKLLQRILHDVGRNNFVSKGRPGETLSRVADLVDRVVVQLGVLEKGIEDSERSLAAVVVKTSLLAKEWQELVEENRKWEERMAQDAKLAEMAREHEKIIRETREGFQKRIDELTAELNDLKLIRANLERLLEASGGMRSASIPSQTIRMAQNSSMDFQRIHFTAQPQACGIVQKQSNSRKTLLLLLSAGLCLMLALSGVAVALVFFFKCNSLDLCDMGRNPPNHSTPMRSRSSRPAA